MLEQQLVDARWREANGLPVEGASSDTIETVLHDQRWRQANGLSGARAATEEAPIPVLEQELADEETKARQTYGLPPVSEEIKQLEG